MVRWTKKRRARYLKETYVKAYKHRYIRNYLKKVTEEFFDYSIVPKE